MSEPPRREPRALTAYGPNVPLPAVVFTWQRPRLNHPDSAAFAVIDQILSGGQSSRLFRTLVYERQLASNAGTFDFGLEDAGIFAAQAVVATGRDIGETETTLAAEIARLRDAPVSEAELAEAKNELVSQALFGRETPEGRAFELGQSLTTANDPRWGDRLLAAVQRVTAADVQRVARRYLADSSRVSLRYLDEAQRPAGQAAYDPSAQPTDAALGRTFPPDTATPNQLAPEGERIAPPAPGAQQPFSAPAFAERRLANGMRVVIARSTNVPIASALLVFGGGTSADPAGRPGVASMMANLVDNGAAGMTAPQIAARVESLGAQIGGAVNPDSSFAFVSAPTANIDAAGALLAQVVREPAFAQEELERERRRALDQLRVSMRDPSFVAQRVAYRAIYGAAPYGSPPGGTPASLAALTREDLAAYHQRLVAAGQCDPRHHRLDGRRGRLRARRAAVRPVGGAVAADARAAGQPRRHGAGAAGDRRRQSGVRPVGRRSRHARHRPQRFGLFPAGRRQFGARRLLDRAPVPGGARAPGAELRRATAASPPIATKACWSRSPRPATMPRRRSPR